MFLYFDMGNVMLHFDHRRAARQMAAVAGVAEETVWNLVFGEGDLNRQLDFGEIDSRRFHEQFCRATGSAPTFDALNWAFSDIFTPNWPIWPIVSSLGSAGYRLGLLSNTCEPHWNFVGQGRYRLMREGFEIYALSYQLKCGKPDPKIFAAATQFAGVSPSEIFFVDDIESHVAGAIEAGWDAILFRGVPELASELARRGLTHNY